VSIGADKFANVLQGLWRPVLLGLLVPMGFFLLLSAFSVVPTVLDLGDRGFAAGFLLSWLIPAAGLGWLMRRRRWSSRFGLTVFFAMVVGEAISVGWMFHEVRLTSQNGAIEGNLHQLDGATDQYFLETPDAVQVSYDDIVGPQRYVKQINSVVGEDYQGLFPVSRDHEDLVVPLPDGRKIIFWSRAGADQKRFFEELPDGRIRYYNRRGAGPDGAAYLKARQQPR